MAKRTINIAKVFEPNKGQGLNKAIQDNLWGTVTRKQLGASTDTSGGYGSAANPGLLSSVLGGSSKAPTSPPASSTTDELLGLVKKTATKGLLSAIGGGTNAIGGIGSILSGLVDLFGGNKTPIIPNLVKFQLPDSVSQIAYTSTSGLQTYQGNVIQPITSGSKPLNSSASQAYRYQSGEIAQAVKQALLNSSTLSDVITEI